ncbi:MAG TPA: hypothetical protein VK735_01190 [Pseudonocardia sp.]|nr:hypothetical protein [Pseudonocardia sp.]HTF46040.1 hypothetical protein [Pseudonocardia sp.]
MSNQRTGASGALKAHQAQAGAVALVPQVRRRVAEALAPESDRQV